MSGEAINQKTFIGNDPFDSSRISLDNGLQQGDFFLGPLVNFVNHAVKNMTECIAKRENSDEYVIFKVLHYDSDEETSDHSQGKILLHNEHLILSLLQDQPGVIHHHGLFKYWNKFILVLDCLISHEYDKKGLNEDFINLQDYVIQKKRLQEREALEIFCSVMTTLKNLHRNNIVHRDLKLGNMVYNQRNRDVIIINFALSKHLVRDNDLLTDQRGSLAYVSPDVLSGSHYDGKASDMWAMGVLLYTMVCGQFPFYDNDPQELFRKICSAEFVIPSTTTEKLDQIFDLIKSLIQKDPQSRLTSTQALDMAQHRLSLLSSQQDHKANTLEEQVVPDSGIDDNVTDCTVPDKNLNLDVKIGDTNFDISHVTAGINIDSFTVGSTKLTGLESASQSDFHRRNPFVDSLSYESQISSTRYLNSSLSSSIQNYSVPEHNLSPQYQYYPHTCDHLNMPNEHLRSSHVHLSENRMSSYQDMDNLVTLQAHSPNRTRSNEQLHVQSHCTHNLMTNLTQKTRRNSSGSESRVRRHSATPLHTVHSMSNAHRQRRRSHDVRDGQGDLLNILHIAATRRRSLSAPFQASLRIQTCSVSDQ